MRKGLVLLPGLALLAGCAGERPHHRPQEPGDAFHPPIEILLQYDANHDGILTRAELENGLKADFAAADTNHDGRLDRDETGAVNNRRWTEGLSTTSTIVDWNQDGYVDFNEFAGTARSLFTQFDRKSEGQIDLRKLAPKPVRPGERDGEPDGGSGQESN